MDFESQVIEQLNTIETKLDGVTEWKAAKQPVCDQHTEQINTLKTSSLAMAGLGIERRLDTIDDTTKAIRKIWVAIITACLIALGGLALQGLQHLSVHRTPATTTTGEP